MLSARRKADGLIVEAYFASRAAGPFICTVCNEEVILRSGRNRIDHFAHVNPISCKFASGESDEHRRCKFEIVKALQKESGVRALALERPVGNVRPDVSFEINGVQVAIEVQISALSVETITARTIEYGRENIYLLWLLQWTPALDTNRYAPKPWERWLHALYFGQVYYWTRGANVMSYRFDPHYRSIPLKTWYSPDRKKISAGGYSQRSKRLRTPVRNAILHIPTDFTARQRYWWQAEDLKLPDAKLFIDNRRDFAGRSN